MTFTCNGVFFTAGYCYFYWSQISECLFPTLLICYEIVIFQYEVLDATHLNSPSSPPSLLPPSLPAGARKQWDGARSRGQVYVHSIKVSTHTHTRSEDGDESDAALPLCKLFPQTAPAVVRGAGCCDSAAVEERLSADTEHDLGPVHR